MALLWPSRAILHSFRLTASVPSIIARHYSSHTSNARLNTPTDFSTTSLLHHTPSSALSNPELPESVRTSSKTARVALHEAVNSALHHALSVDDTVLLFGEDISFGGVFRCSANLATDF